MDSSKTITSNKRNLKGIKGANEGQGQIRKASGKAAILCVAIINFTANVNPNNPY